MLSLIILELGKFPAVGETVIIPHIVLHGTAQIILLPDLKQRLVHGIVIHDYSIQAGIQNALGFSRFYHPGTDTFLAHAAEEIGFEPFFPHDSYTLSAIFCGISIAEKGAAVH